MSNNPVKSYVIGGGVRVCLCKKKTSNGNRTELSGCSLYESKTNEPFIKRWVFWGASFSYQFAVRKEGAVCPKRYPETTALNFGHDCKLWEFLSIIASFV